jgi:hypothetical protein
MTPSTSWGVLAAVPLSCGVLLRVVMSERFLWVARCRVASPHLISYGTVVASLLALAVTFTFATAAAQNGDFVPVRRFLWVTGLLLFSPVLAPVYWWRYMRGRKAA